MGAALVNVKDYQQGSELAELQTFFGSKVVGTSTNVMDMFTSQKAALHQGTTKLSATQTRPCPVEDCYGFVPYDLHDAPELNVLEVKGIALLTWDPVEAQEVADIGDNDIAGMYYVRL